MASGEITSRDIQMADIAKTYIWRKSAELTPGLKMFKEEGFPSIDAKWAFPLEVDGEFPVPEGAVARRKRIEYVQFGATMEMAEFRYMITDWAAARGLTAMTHRDMQRRAAEYIAKCQNRQIVDTLYAGAGATGVTAADTWDSNSAVEDIAGDIVDAWNYIVDESNVDPEAQPMYLVYPTKCAGQFKALRYINNVQQNLQTYLTATLGIMFMPTRYYHASSSIGIRDDAMLVVPGSNTMMHKYYTGGQMPMSEVERVFGRGKDFLIKKMFFSKIEPDTQSDATTDRISIISDVL